MPSIVRSATFVRDVHVALLTRVGFRSWTSGLWNELSHRTTRVQMPCLKSFLPARSSSCLVHAVPHTSLLASLATAAKTPKQIQPHFTRRAENVNVRTTEAPMHEEEQAAASGSSSSTAQAHESAQQLPSCASFGGMYNRLEEWSSTYHTSHVPHHVFDAADLGAWVRELRHQQRRGALERWKLDQLNRLGFQWLISKDDAKWHANVHHLRQFRSLHGPTALPYNDGQHGAWRELAGWVQEQGELLTSGRLPLVKQQTLEAVGVTLSVDADVAARHVKLQGLNGHERRLIRKRWKAQDAAKAEKAKRAEEQLLLATHALVQLRDEEKQRRQRIRSVIYSGSSADDGYSLLAPIPSDEDVQEDQDQDLGGYLSREEYGYLSVSAAHTMPATPGYISSPEEYDIDW